MHRITGSLVMHRSWMANGGRNKYSFWQSLWSKDTWVQELKNRTWQGLTAGSDLSDVLISITCPGSALYEFEQLVSLETGSLVSSSFN